ncbi:MAG: single-stranded DNA-binding protein [Halanaerobiales bacterium]|mgnify:FL=1
MLNRIILIGRLTRDPEMRYTSNGIAVTSFTLAVQRNYANQQGEREVDFINIVTWRKLAEHCAQYLGKGQLVAVEGSLQIRKNESGGRTYINPEVVADNVRFLEWRGDRPANDYGGQNYGGHSNDFGTQSNDEADDDVFDLDLGDDFDVPF